MHHVGHTPAERDRLLALLKRHGHNTTSFQILEPGLHYWFDGDDACVAYAEAGRSWVVAGGPIAPAEREREVMKRFICLAAEHKRRVRFFGLEDDLAHDDELRYMPIGEQPFWDPHRWADVLKQRRSLREQLRRARAKGVTVRLVSEAELERSDAPVRQGIDRLISHWIDSRAMAPMGFVVSLDLYHLPEERRFFIAEHNRNVVGVLAAVPIYARDGWFFEDVLRDPEAPNGTMELLFDFAMRMLADEGSVHVTFGLAPLAGTSSRSLRLIRYYTRWLYDFEGLRSFKNKLTPTSWDPVYLGYPKRERGIMAIVDVLRAFAHGSFVRFGIDTLIHRAALVVTILALMLLPWSMLLLLVEPSQWFPSRAVQYAWVGVDLVLFGSLIWLATKWRRWLALTLSAAALGDFALGCVQLAFHNAQRASSFADWFVYVIALAAPLFAATFLFLARDRNTRYDRFPGLADDRS